MKPVMAAASAAPSTNAREEELVAQAMAGSSVAFEALFKRYRDRITGYVRTIIPNYARAEDVVQEIFVSALRKLHTLEEPAAFRSWLYEIARNACLDDVRRVKRGGEILIRSNDFGPYDEQRNRHVQSTHGKVTWREQLHHLKEALGGLPDSQHEALLLREFGGMSYDEIGEQMNLSRPAVESMLFRARRGLKDEYGEITTGKRCRRMQGVMVEIAEGLGGMRDRRLLLRHMRECTGCRRQATAMGFTGIAVPPEAGPVRRGVSRVAALLPLPFLFNRRPEGGEQVAGSGSSLGMQAQGIATQVSVAGNVSADHVSSAIHKAAAVVAAVAVIGGGAGVAVEQSGVRIPLIQAKDKPGPANSEQSGESDAAAAPGAAEPARHGAFANAGNQAASPASAGHGTGAAPPALSGPAAADPGSLGPAGTPETGTAPADGSSPAVTEPATDTPADSGGQTPTSDTGSGGSGGSGGATTQGTDPAGSTSPSTSPQGTGQPSTSTGGGPPAPAGTESLPPGWQKKIESGAATLGDLPPGLAKKLAAASAS